MQTAPEDVKAGGRNAPDGKGAGSAGRRYHELDSLRGIASLLVVFSHFLGLYPGLVVYLHGAHPFAAALLGRFYDAHDAVLLFFLLSGFVLALPFVRGRPQSYKVFVIRRITRIYFPYLAALALAIAADALLHGILTTRGLWTGLVWNGPPAMPEIAQHVLFLGAYNNEAFNLAFWSLTYEMRISLVFPLLIALHLRCNLALRAGLIALLTSAGIIGMRFSPAFAEYFTTVHYAAIMMLGASLAAYLPQLDAALRRLRPGNRVGLFLAGIVLLARGGVFEQTSFIARWKTDWIEALGGSMVLLLSLTAQPIRHWLLRRTPLFLGRISYSLYLIHSTVLLSLAVSPQTGWLLLPMFAVYLLGSLFCAWIFCIWIEEPAMRFGRRLTPSREHAIPAS